jgi:hypothetical protein
LSRSTHQWGSSIPRLRKRWKRKWQNDPWHIMPGCHVFCLPPQAEGVTTLRRPAGHIENAGPRARSIDTEPMPHVTCAIELVGGRPESHDTA